MEGRELLAPVEPRNETAPSLDALIRQYRHRGLAESARMEAQAQRAEEQKSIALAPEAYRLSNLTDAAVRGIYRHGREEMTAADFLRYYEECRALREKKHPLEAPVGIYESAVPENAGLSLPIQTKVHPLPAKVTGKIKSLTACAVSTVRNGLPTWFDTRPVDTSKEKRSFPVSALAAILTVAVCLMLIVTGSLMVNSAEQSIGRLNKEIKTISSDIDDLKSDLRSDENLLRVRDVAVEQYGMIGEDFVKMEYLSLDAEDQIEVFREEQAGGIRLSTILSVFGLK